MTRRSFILIFTNYVLKLLSSELDEAYNGLIQKVFIKGIDVEIFSEFRPPPFLREPLKVLERLLGFDCQF